MSDAPMGPHWWRAGDGKWYPAPPGLADAASSRAPMPPPDHEPVAPTRSAPSGAGVYRAGRVGAPATTPPAPRRHGRAVALALAVAALVMVLVASATGLVSGHSTRRASSDDPAYQQSIVDLLGSETTNLVFLQTFWEDERAHLSGGSNRSNTPGGANGGPVVDPAWLDDMQAQVDQFAADLAAIDAAYESRPWPDGSIPDRLRDLARDHYRAWRDWTRDLPAIARQWATARTALDLAAWMDQHAPGLDATIEQTFEALCAALAETAPADGRFDTTIADICAP